ncbi:MAG: hypothetical protein LBJ03_03835 [Holosporales bacterium]|nr:hypothetical protein [Holosporales bacterium]
MQIFNASLLRCVKSIMEKDSNAVIIVQADHGITCLHDHTNITDVNSLRKHVGEIRPCSNREARYRFGIFSAVYIPERLRSCCADFDIYDYFSGNFSLVNMFRVLFATLGEEKPSLLPDRSIFLYFDRQANAYRAHKVYEKSDLEVK